jgi:ATP-dependent Clp protease ATP-binding subunit ClpC
LPLPDADEPQRLIVMFERFSELARRALFFSRYEASQLGSLTIEGEHLLLGVMREPNGPVARVLDALPLNDVRAELEARRSGQKVSTSVEIPFSAEAKRMLHSASIEADRLENRYIEVEHLLLGVLCEENSVGARTLGKYGLHLGAARDLVRKGDPPRSSDELIASARARVDRILDLVPALGTELTSIEDAEIELAGLRRHLLALKALLDARS